MLQVTLIVVGAAVRCPDTHWGANGEIQNLTFNMSVEVSPLDWVPLYVTADPTNDLAAILALDFEESEGLVQLASYTVDGQGDLSTTAQGDPTTPNAGNMPYPKVNARILNMSPSSHLPSRSQETWPTHFRAAHKQPDCRSSISDRREPHHILFRGPHHHAHR